MLCNKKSLLETIKGEDWEKITSKRLKVIVLLKRKRNKETKKESNKLVIKKERNKQAKKIQRKKQTSKDRERKAKKN